MDFPGGTSSKPACQYWSCKRQEVQSLGPKKTPCRRAWLPQYSCLEKLTEEPQWSCKSKFGELDTTKVT